MHSHLISCGQFGKISGRGIAQGWTGFRQILHHLAGCLSLNFRIASFQAAGKVTRFRIRFILSGPIGIFSKDGFLRSQCGRIPVRFQICRQIAQKFQKAGSALRNGSSGIAFPPCKYKSPANSTLEYLDLSTPAQAFLTACTSVL